ncbi:hypothetical protein [Methylosinus sp. Ce-a6]|uniref:hypothetical protein n=1 Tax=Methylosinus sp. Ce-a6 TaxID=2172005 RepID=UPI001356C65F|nr:hypothetical protein [Methylosinus sp. Ce-a6]
MNDDATATHDGPMKFESAGRAESVGADLEGLPAEALKRLWPAWRDSNRLDVSRQALRACAADLSWTHGPNAVSIARRIAEDFVTFPEFELEIDNRDLAKKIAGFESENARAFNAILAFLINPHDKHCLEEVILEAARANDEDAVRRLMRRLLDCSDFGLHVTRILSRLSDERLTLPVDVLGAIVQRLPTGAGTLSGLMLREALVEALAPNAPQTLATRNIPATAKYLIDLAEAKRTTRVIRRETTLNEALIEKLGAEVRRRLAPMAPKETANENKPRVKQESGVVGWLEAILQFGSVTLQTSSLRSNYAKIGSDGLLTAETHPLGSAFQYGPYVTLPPGYYSVTFIGEMTTPAVAEFVVTSAFSQNVLASCAIVATDSVPLAQLTFLLSQREDNCEFIIRVKSSAGRVRSRGVEIDWRPL